MAEINDNIHTSELYNQDVIAVADLALPWELLQGKSLLLTGATGMIGSFLVDVLMYRNIHCNLDCDLFLVGRSEKKAYQRFPKHIGVKTFHFLECRDITKQIPDCAQNLSYYIHAASNTHPVAYATDPIGTIRLNVTALDNLLEHAVQHHAERFLYLSSNEIYGENRGDTELFEESYCGYIDCNTLRAGYPESKRAGEALCQAYLHQKGLDIVIPRLTRSYGPTMLDSDTKALSQFIRNAMNHENIVLKSPGTQQYSFTYMADAVSGIFYCLLLGKTGEAYNIADPSGNISLRQLAELIAEMSGTHVVHETPDAVEKNGYSTATKALLDSNKLCGLGWTPLFTLEKGIAHTLGNE